MKTIKTLTAIALAAVLAFAFGGCSQDAGDSHEHAFTAEWTSSETHHWHAATCGHDLKKDESSHEWDHENFQYDAASGNEIRTCSVCGYVNSKTHVHTWDHEDFQFDAASGKEIKTCTVCCFVADKNHAHTEDNGTVTTAPTCVTKGVRTYNCSVCKVKLRTVKLPELYSSPIDVDTDQPATKSSRYIYFGVFPRSVLPANSTVTVDETISVKMGADTYYKGSDGEYYAKVKEDAYGTETKYKYSDGTKVKENSSYSYRYFKVEPIK